MPRAFKGTQTNLDATVGNVELEPVVGRMLVDDAASDDVVNKIGVYKTFDVSLSPLHSKAMCPPSRTRLTRR